MTFLNVINKDFYHFFSSGIPMLARCLNHGEHVLQQDSIVAEQLANHYIGR